MAARKTKPEGRPRIGVATKVVIEDGDLEQIKLIAAEEERPVAHVVRRLLRQALAASR